VIFAPRGQNVHAIRQHPQRLLSDFRVHRRHPASA
jgi:hypothetical protein